MCFVYAHVYVCVDVQVLESAYAVDMHVYGRWCVCVYTQKQIIL